MSKITDFFTNSTSSGAANAKIAQDDLVWKVTQLGTNEHIEQGKGFIFEYLENAKLNELRGRQGLRYENILTGFPRERGGFGEPYAPDDLRINGVSYQCKVHADIADYFPDIYNPKYKNMGFVVPNDQYEQIQAELFSRYQNGSIPQKNYLDYKSRIFQGYTSTRELYRYCDENGYLDPEIAQAEASRAVNNAFLKDCIQTSKISTLSYMITGSVISSVKNVNKCMKSEISSTECLKTICKDTAKSAGKGLAIGTLANALSFIGHSSSNASILSNGTVSLTLANGVFDLGATYREYLSGNIDSANFYEQIIAKSVVTAVSLFARVTLITNPILSTITTCVLSSITNELLRGRHHCVCIGSAALFDETFSRKIEEENQAMLERLTHLLHKQSAAYDTVKEYLQNINISRDTPCVLQSLKDIATLLNLPISFDSFEEFQNVMQKKTFISI